MIFTVNSDFFPNQNQPVGLYNLECSVYCETETELFKMSLITLNAFKYFMLEANCFLWHLVANCCRC